MPHLDSAVLHGIEDLQAGNDFAGGKHLDPKFVVGRFGHGLGHDLSSTVERIERFRPAARHSPFDFRSRLRDRRRGNGGPRDAYPRGLDEITTFHRTLPWCCDVCRQPSCRGLWSAWNIRFGISMPNLTCRNAKSLAAFPHPQHLHGAACLFQVG